MEREPFLTVVDDPAALAETAAREIAVTARQAVGERGRFMVALAGGATPRDTHRRLTLPPWVEAMPWDRTWVFFGDERCVPPDHPESNYRMAHETLLAKVPVPPEQVFRMRGEEDDADAAATDYARRLGAALEPRRSKLPRFDLVVLGMGLDGHTASLFPGSPVLKEVFRRVAAVHAAAAAIPRRLTLTLPVLNAARRVIFLVAGAEKAKAMKAVMTEPASLPAGMVRPTDGDLTWIVDRAAASLLSPRPPATPRA